MRHVYAKFLLLFLTLLLVQSGSSLPIANAAFSTPVEIMDNTGDVGGNALDGAHGIAVDSSGNVYVAGNISDNVFKITPAGVKTEIIDTGGDRGGNALDGAWSVAVDSSGNVYVTGNISDNVFKINTPGTCSTGGVACTITEIIDDAGDVGGGNTLDGAIGVAVDSSGNVYVTGNISDNVFKINTPGTCSTGGVACTITEIIDDAGDTTGNTLDQPWYVAVDSSGNVYVTGNATSNAFKINTPGTCSTGGVACTITEIIDDAGDVGGGNALTGARGIAVDSSGNVFVTGYISDNVFKINTPGTCSTGGVACTITEIIDDVGGGNALDGAIGVAVDDSSGNVYVAGDRSDNAFKINTPGTCSTGGTPCTITEIIDDAGDVGGGNSLDGSYAVVVDSSGNVYVAGNVSDNAFKISIIIESTTAIETSGGSSANKHNTKPTFGIDHKTNIQKITGGFSVNDESFDITDNFWTPFEYKKLKLGETNSFAIKVFAEQKLRVQEFLFGIPNVGDAHLAELRVEVYFDSYGEIEKFQVVQFTNIVDMNTLTVEKYPSKCLPDEKDEKCITTLISMKFLEPLKDDVMALKAIDYKNRVITTYLNDGFDISGDSLNPMKTIQIPGPDKYEGLITVTQIAKYSDVWIADDNGRVFERNESGTFTQINDGYFERHIDSAKTMMNRNHSEFYILINDEINRAQILAEQLCKHCYDKTFVEINDIFAYDYPTSIPKSEDPKIQELLVAENLKAQEILDENNTS